MISNIVAVFVISAVVLTNRCDACAAMQNQPTCTSCTASSLNPRAADRLTSFAISTEANGCLQAQPTCIAQRNTIVALDILIQYSDGTFGVQRSTAVVTLVCNTNGVFIDSSNNKPVTAVFCYEVLNTADCAICGTSQTSPLIQTLPTTNTVDINVPIYNRTQSSPNYCCDAPGALQSGQSFTSLLSSLLPLTDPSATGLIGSANCSTNQLLCVCGANNPIVQPDCYVGLNDAHVYLIEFCTSNTACEVLAIPFTGLLSSVLADGTSSGHQISPVVDTSFDTTFQDTFPIVQFMTCVSNNAAGQMQCGEEANVLFNLG